MPHFLSSLGFPLAFLAAGALLLYGAVFVLGEYGRALVRDPRALMSFEVLGQLLGAGGPGYLSMLLLMCAASLLFIGAVSLFTVLGFVLGDFWRVLFPAG